MHSCCGSCFPRRHGGRSTFGEALLALAALAGFAVAYNQGSIVEWSDVWFFAGVLGLIVVFYFLLLFARFLFVAMVSGTEYGLSQCGCCESKGNGTPKKK